MCEHWKTAREHELNSATSEPASGVARRFAQHCGADLTKRSFEVSHSHRFLICVEPERQEEVMRLGRNETCRDARTHTMRGADADGGGDGLRGR